jgi:mycothiol synthase
MRLRPAGPDDLDAVLAVLHARDLADLGVTDYTREDLDEEWSLSEVDLAWDTVVAETDAGEIVGYALIRSPGTMAVVAPDHEGEGIGAQLLAWAERRARERGDRRHRQWIAGGDERARALLLGAGYQPERSYWRMFRPLDGPLDAPSPPAGITLRPLDVDADAVRVHALNEVSFATNPDYRPETLAEFGEEHLRAHDLAPELSCLATDGQALVGFLLARRWSGEGVGYVDLLGVDPAYRARGLATVLLLTAFARFAADGLREAQLGVASDNPRALRLYERCGMTPRFRMDTFQRPVDPPSE